MNKQNKKSNWLIPVLVTGLAFIGVITFHIDNVKAANIYGCNPSSERLSEVDTQEKFEDYLKSIDVDYSKYISKAGKTLTINKNYAINKCLIVYGSPSDVKNEGRKVQEYSAGQPKFYGYNTKGQLFPNPEYPDVAPTANYVSTKPFTYHPWSNTNLNTNIKNSPTKPFTNKPTNTSYYDKHTDKTYNAEDELNRTIDRIYLMNCGSNCSKGSRGYFPSYNDALGKTLVGSNLKDYASVSEWPDTYSAGVFNTYYYSNISNTYWSATFVIPPHRLFLQEERDLSIKIKSINPSTVIEGKNYTITYQICNNGETSVANPVIHYGEGSASKSKTIKTTLGVNDCYSSSLSETAKSVSSDTTATYYMEVNKNHKNPKDESNWNNNKDNKSFTIENKVIDGSVTITNHTPTYPHSKESIDVTFKVCNNSNVEVFNVFAKYGFSGQSTEKQSISHMNSGECLTYTKTHTTPTIKDYTGTSTYKVTLGGFEDDINPSNNTDSKIITIRNPDAIVDIISDNDSTDNTIGDVKVKVESRMWSKITQDCSTSNAKCLSGTNKKKYTISIYDTKFTPTTSDDVLVASYTPSYSLEYGENNYYNIGRNVFTNWVKNHYPDTYQLVQFKIVVQIPEYAVEVNYNGDPSYENNKDESTINYFPPRPSIAATQCNEVEHSIVSYFNTSGGSNPIKMCAGHYPTYPSTTVESGMQAYHYVLYRFFPQPIPKYSVTTPETNVSNPNHFSQLFQLPNLENNNVMGDFESMFIPNKLSNGYYQERGRYMPTGGTFNFQVYKKNTDDSKGQQIALGTVSYNIPSTCYNHYYLDIDHQYACDEILFFLPNADTAAKFQKPSSYNSSNINYPISGTKIPYLNPGKYTFEFKANENFRYYYQTNLINSGYKWSNPKFK
ncbi:hypothetical protein AAGG74_14575 [Bacillus mexicanus]|uniref:Athe_2463 domain-containing protein n=1 Tax=Bacillus mexicanus TaxID=2834415 RepID=UPI003D196C31